MCMSTKLGNVRGYQIFSWEFYEYCMGFLAHRRAIYSVVIYYFNSWKLWDQSREATCPSSCCTLCMPTHIFLHVTKSLPSLMYPQQLIVHVITIAMFMVVAIVVLSLRYYVIILLPLANIHFYSRALLPWWVYIILVICIFLYSFSHKSVSSVLWHLIFIFYFI